jgi:outer membrane biogenesis lipoprotein LolB
MVRSKMMTVLALVLASGLLAACKTGTATPPPQIFTTDAYQPLNLNARRLEIIDNWQMPVVDPYIGHRVSPCQALFWPIGHRMCFALLVAAARLFSI